MSKATQPPGSAPEGSQHKNDMYGDIAARNESDAGVAPPIPAATVVLLRDGAAGVEVLMLKKSSKITFGGMWVFPGGRIDPQDYGSADAKSATAETHNVAAQQAAVRETHEEAGLHIESDDFVWFAHWTPPPGPQKRFATWFFAAQVSDDQPIRIDDGEIKDHAWIRPQEALARHKAGEIDLVPPTWVTLYQLSLYEPTAAVLAQLAQQPTRVYNTRVVQAADGNRVAMWHGDAGYDAWAPDTPGPRHRLVMASEGFQFDNSVEDY